MTGALIILAVLIAVGLLIWALDGKTSHHHHNVKTPRRTEDTTSEGDTHEEEHDHADGEICCGRHTDCEKSLSPMPGEEIVYYDDEELDRFKGTAPDAYTDEAVEEFREVLMTLRQEDAAGWVRSLQLREIAIPEALRDEIIMIVDN